MCGLCVYCGGVVVVYGCFLGCVFVILEVDVIVDVEVGLVIVGIVVVKFIVYY